MKPEFDGLTVTSEIYSQRNNIKLGAVLQYLFNHKGPLATTGCDHGAFVSTTGAEGGGREHSVCHASKPRLVHDALPATVGHQGGRVHPCWKPIP